MCQIGPDKDFTKHFGCDCFLPRFISFICAIHGDNSKQYLHHMDHNEMKGVNYQMQHNPPSSYLLFVTIDRLIMK